MNLTPTIETEKIPTTRRTGGPGGREPSRQPSTPPPTLRNP